jgi:hypothetical protein
MRNYLKTEVLLVVLVRSAHVKKDFWQSNRAHEISIYICKFILDCSLALLSLRQLADGSRATELRTVGHGGSLRTGQRALRGGVRTSASACVWVYVSVSLFNVWKCVCACM